MIVIEIVIIYLIGGTSNQHYYSSLSYGKRLLRRTKINLDHI